MLLHARVPIIKAEAYLPGGSVLLDISLDGPDHSGLAAAALLRSLTGRMPLLGPLVLLFKDFLKSKGLCDSHNGGLSSYGEASIHQAAHSLIGCRLDSFVPNFVFMYRSHAYGDIVSAEMYGGPAVHSRSRQSRSRRAFCRCS